VPSRQYGSGVDAQEADVRYDRLVADLATLQEWLEDRDETLWANWLETSRRQILARDGYGLTHLLGAYGGMGSFVDLQISDDMSRLRTRIYEDASALLGDLQR
jgi:hypothetical protein